MLLLSFIFVIECGLLEVKQICTGFSLCAYIYIAFRDPIIKRGRAEIPSTSLTLLYFCACPKLGPGCLMPYVVDFVCSIISGER